jgi:hypothetical protein
MAIITENSGRVVARSVEGRYFTFRVEVARLPSKKPLRLATAEALVERVALRPFTKFREVLYSTDDPAPWRVSILVVESIAAPTAPVGLSAARDTCNP